MSVSTLPSPRDTTSIQRMWHSARAALAKAAATATHAASEARHRYRRPSLVISSFGCIDAAAWTTFGLGAGLLTIGVSLFVFEMIGDDE